MIVFHSLASALSLISLFNLSSSLLHVKWFLTFVFHFFQKMVQQQPFDFCFYLFMCGVFVLFKSLCFISSSSWDKPASGCFLPASSTIFTSSGRTTYIWAVFSSTMLCPPWPWPSACCDASYGCVFGDRASVMAYTDASMSFFSFSTTVFRFMLCPFSVL